ncbi:hypothetical protein HYFRA_00004179 [Hymenoscyphus fraxineus]|uniref:Uncharacterized protein n=1 Tax=Hymenoscyphus fraxineus TaxID=746836 RepID=A0A9N9PPW3_9HELO|nr:hypothetical protein HYFRA_00004179 [Hymenoscyphus fraxineus]
MPQRAVFRPARGLDLPQRKFALGFMTPLWSSGHECQQPVVPLSTLAKTCVCLALGIRPETTSALMTQGIAILATYSSDLQACLAVRAKR